MISIFYFIQFNKLHISPAISSNTFNLFLYILWKKRCVFTKMPGVARINLSRKTAQQGGYCDLSFDYRALGCRKTVLRLCPRRNRIRL